MKAEKGRLEMYAIGLTVIGLVVGLLAWLIKKGSGAELLGYAVVGFTGAIVGGMLFKAVGLFPDGQAGAFIAAAAGATLLLVFVEIIKKV
jgi:uncharacterized membrane protein YeaQ/YmgE (transglycosylase-associated protein family)